MAVRPDRYFAAEEIERARRYHRPLYAALVAELAILVAVPALFTFTRAGDGLDSLPWWGAAPLLATIVVVALGLAELPISLVRYRHERRWGFSTQSVRGWLADRGRTSSLAVVLAALPLTGLVALARATPTWWPLAGAVSGALLALVVSFLAPVVLEPVFNRFRPLEDEALAAELRALADRAGVPVRDVLVADASRRTRKHNAYVSGLGRTRRVVVFDTLLDRARPRELKLVIAHELGHRRARHVLKATVLAMAGAAAGVVALWGVLRWDSLREAVGATGAGDPRVVPFVMLASSVAQLVLAPIGAALSRRWEREADRFSLDLTRDREGYDAAHRELARANLADLDPPRALYLLSFTHPTPPERLAAVS